MIDMRAREPGVGRGRYTRMHGLMAVLLSKIGLLTPRMTRELHVLVEGEWGTVTRRSVNRALAKLVARGEVKRTEDGYLLARCGER